MRRDDCVQPDREILMSEDCLYLSVYAPLKTASGFGKWPVMVFFYGGSFGAGGIGLIPLYNGRGIVDTTAGHVVIFVNYRISALGFLGSDELAADSSDGSTGNYGLQDQRQALFWARENIAAFGGDPTNVMIFGESAGAWSVQDHVLMKKSAGLFQGAIMESGYHNGLVVHVLFLFFVFVFHFFAGLSLSYTALSLSQDVCDEQGAVQRAMGEIFGTDGLQPRP